MKTKILIMGIIFFGGLFLPTFAAKADSCGSPILCSASTVGQTCCLDANTSGSCQLVAGYYICVSSTPSSGSTAPTPATTAPAATTTTVATIPFINPLQFNTVDALVSSILSNLNGIIIVLAIIFIIIGGILYITSTGNDKRMEAAKACITGALIGLAIAIAAPSFLKEIAIVLGWNNVSAQLSKRSHPIDHRPQRPELPARNRWNSGHHHDDCRRSDVSHFGGRRG